MNMMLKLFNIVKWLLFTIFYPFWFFLAKTWVGNVLMVCLVPLVPVFVIGFLTPNLMDLRGEAAEGVAKGMVIVCLFLSPFIASLLMSLSIYLEKHYKKWNYKIEMGTKMP